MSAKRLLGVFLGVSVVFGLWLMMNRNNAQISSVPQVENESAKTLTFSIDKTVNKAGLLQQSVSGDDKNTSKVQTAKDKFESGPVPTDNESHMTSIDESINMPDAAGHEAELLKDVDKQTLPVPDKTETRVKESSGSKDGKVAPILNNITNSSKINEEINRHFFWKPFTTMNRAIGFSEMVTSTSGVPCKVKKENPVEHRVYFEYEDEQDRADKIARIENKMGIRIGPEGGDE